MSPYVAGAAALVLVASHACAWHLGRQAGEDKVTAQQAREEDVRQKTYDDAQRGAAAAIAANKPRQVTIRQETQREIETRVEYRTCVHSPEQLQRINEALTGRAVGAGAGQLPGGGATQ